MFVEFALVSVILLLLLATLALHSINRTLRERNRRAVAEHATSTGLLRENISELQRARLRVR